MLLNLCDKILGEQPMLNLINSLSTLIGERLKE
jgi:hypothetical protein